MGSGDKDSKGTNAAMKKLDRLRQTGSGHLDASRRIAETLKEHQIRHTYRENRGRTQLCPLQQHMIGNLFLCSFASETRGDRREAVDKALLAPELAAE